MYDYYHYILLLSLYIIIIIIIIISSSSSSSSMFIVIIKHTYENIVNIMYSIYVLCPARCTARPSLPKPIEGHGLLTGHNGHNGRNGHNGHNGPFVFLILFYGFSVQHIVF